MTAKKTATRLEADLAQDTRGVYLRQAQTQLMQGRAALRAETAPLARHTVRAYDAALAVLPDIWKAMQRRN